MLQLIHEMELTLFFHAGDATLGNHLFREHSLFSGEFVRPECLTKWEHTENSEAVLRSNEIAEAYGISGQAVQVSWLLNQEFPTIAIVAAPTLLTAIGEDYLIGSHLELTLEDLRYLSSARTHLNT